MGDLGRRDSPLNLRALSLLTLAVAVHGIQTQPAPPAATPLAVMSKEGRRPLAVTMVGDQEFVALDDLASLFQLTVHEDPLGAITVSYKGKTIVLTTDQALASVAGKLISLPAAPVRSGRRSLVPVEFISRALASVYDAKLDLRKPSRLLIVGDLRVPRVTVRFEAIGSGARLTIDATPRAASAVTQENDRLVIKFDVDALDVSLPQIPAQGVISGVRIADPVSLAVDLGPRFGAFRATAQPLDAASRQTIDVLAAQTEPASAASPPPGTPGTAAPPAPSASPAPLPDLSSVGQPASAIRTIAIDAGHGGDDAGVVGPSGTKEKDVTLAIARRAKAAIEGRLGIRVLMTRDDDRSIPLDDRSALANNNKADLFLSLHASASLRRGTTGAAVFFAAFEKGAEDKARASLGTERLPTFSGGSRDIELLAWDLAQIRHVEQSEQLAHLLEQQFHDRVPISLHPVERAPLHLLASANMPAVIVEIGYLTNADQEKQLVAGDFQNTLVQAIVDAVVKFRDALDAGRGTR
jgi:N-acetylmuramoyl-L-alanine amidase